MRLYESIYDVYDVFTICTYIQGAAIKPIQEIGPLHASALEKVNTNTIMTLIPLKKNTNSYYLEETMINMSRLKMHCIVLYCIVLYFVNLLSLLHPSIIPLSSSSTQSYLLCLFKQGKKIKADPQSSTTDVSDERVKEIV